MLIHLFVVGVFVIVIVAVDLPVWFIIIFSTSLHFSSSTIFASPYSYSTLSFVFIMIGDASAAAAVGRDCLYVIAVLTTSTICEMVGWTPACWLNWLVLVCPYVRPSIYPSILGEAVWICPSRGITRCVRPAVCLWRVTHHRMEWCGWSDRRTHILVSRHHLFLSMLRLKQIRIMPLLQMCSLITGLCSALEM